MTDQPGLPPKKDVALALLQTEMSVYVHLDPRVEGVMVPTWLQNQPQLVLQIGMNMSVPIPDLDVGEEAVSCTLSFNRRPEYCYLPYEAIFGLIGEGGRGMIWPESVPPEVAAQAPGRATTAEVKGRKRPRLAAVRDASEPGDESPSVKGSDDRPGSTGPQKVASERALQAAGSSERSIGAGEEAPAAKEESQAPEGASKSGDERAPTPDAASEKEGAVRSRKLPPYLRVVK